MAENATAKSIYDGLLKADWSVNYTYRSVISPRLPQRLKGDWAKIGRNNSRVPRFKNHPDIRTFQVRLVLDKLPTSNKF